MYIQMKIQMKIYSPCTFLLVASPCASPHYLAPWSCCWCLPPLPSASTLSPSTFYLYLLPLPSTFYLLPVPSTFCRFLLHSPLLATFYLYLLPVPRIPDPRAFSNHPSPQHCPSTFSLDLPPSASSHCLLPLQLPSTLTLYTV